MAEATLSKVAQVKQLFESPQWYLEGTACNIRIRQETVRYWAEGANFHKILDLGCGDGSISLSLSREDNYLTLLDVSTGMLEIARSRVRESGRDNVELINADLMHASLKPAAYDLILCLGVLAHVDSPAATITKIAKLLRPSGVLILEFTDAFHAIGIPTVVLNQIRRAYGQSTYGLNLLSRRRIGAMLKASNLGTVSVFRYSLRLPGIYKLFSQDTLYRAARTIFGTAAANRNAFLGNQYIYLIRKQH